MATNSWLSRLLVFWPGRPWNAGLFFSVAGKATLLWPGLPQNPGLDRAYQAFPGHAFLASPAKILASLAWPGLAGLGMLLTTLLMQGLRRIKTAHVLCVWLISVEYVDKQRTFQTGNTLHIFKNETSHFRQHFALKVYWTCNSLKYLLLQYAVIM